MHHASPAPLFAYFFWRNRKSRSAKQQLRYYRMPVHADNPSVKTCGFATSPCTGEALGRTESSAPTECSKIKSTGRQHLPLHDATKLRARADRVVRPYGCGDNREHGRTESSAPTRTATNALRQRLRAFVISFAPAKWDAAASDTARANSRHPAPDVSRCRVCAGSYGAYASPPG